jgi:phosphoribosylaminoimidazolecarboxamide formyltransferase/IMP cyclohydrolase
MRITQTYALVSVFDKTGIGRFARILAGLKYKIISTGGTAKTLTDDQVAVVPIGKITGNPEALDGRMKTISFAIEGGILVDRRKASHRRQAKELKLPDIRVVVCNLYPFAQTVANPKSTLDEAVEQIDVGGPTMIRAAAKNFANVVVVVDPTDYDRVALALQKNTLTLSLRQELAAKAFAHLSYYDAQIARYLNKQTFPGELTLPLQLGVPLRYGDNPDQQAALYFSAGVSSPLRRLERLAGRELSATNVTDIDAGIKAVKLFREPASVVIKHNSPCGIALGTTAKAALMRSLASDPESAFGGVVVMNTPMTFAAAQAIASFKEAGRGNMDIVAVPHIDAKALSLLQQIRKSTGVYTFGELEQSRVLYHIRWVEDGAVVQTLNDPEVSFGAWQVVTQHKPTKKQLHQMQLGWKFASRIRSNTVMVIDKELPLSRGIGAGQTSRVLSTKIALERAGVSTKGGILVSDSFFPFADSVELAAAAGIGAIVQQGGSKNDPLVIAAANRAGIPMIFTSQRVFWH